MGRGRLERVSRVRSFRMQEMKVTVGSAFIALILSCVAANAETRLICENARSEYLVVYAPGAPDLVLNPDTDRTLYQVLIDDPSDGSHVVIAVTSNGGPTARLHLRPYVKMEFWSDGQMIQTDGCHAAE